MKKGTRYGSIDQPIPCRRGGSHHRRMARDGGHRRSCHSVAPSADSVVCGRSVDLDRRAVDGSVRLVETGSAVVEGIVAVAIVFILFTVVSQLAVALLAQQTAEAAVASAAREASLRPGFSEERLLADLRATVPGAGRIEAGLINDGRLSIAWARFEFLPPGPLFRSIEISVEAEVPVVVAP